MLNVGDIIYTINRNKTFVIGTDMEGNLLCKEHSLSQVSYNAGRHIEEQNIVNITRYKMADFGITVFFDEQDVENAGDLMKLGERYKFNRDNILESKTENEAQMRRDYEQYRPNALELDENKYRSIVRGYASDLNEEMDFHMKNPDCFARLDLDTTYMKKPYSYKERFYYKLYISKEKYRRVDNAIIINWRAPISALYYGHQNSILLNDTPDIFHSRKIRNNIYQYELMLKRQYKENPFECRTLFIAGGNIINNKGVDKFLIDSINQSRENYKFSDIVKTIQENQDSIIRAKPSTNLVVQGCAGSGKTVILLHRLSYLLYNKFILPDKTKIITPSNDFNVFICELMEELEIKKIDAITFYKYEVQLIKSYAQKLEPISIKISISEEEELNHTNDYSGIATETRKCYEEYVSEYFNEIQYEKLLEIAKRLDISIRDYSYNKNKLGVINQFCNSAVWDKNSKYVDEIKRLKFRVGTGTKRIEENQIEIKRNEKYSGMNNYSGEIHRRKVEMQSLYRELLKHKKRLSELEAKVLKDDDIAIINSAQLLLKDRTDIVNYVYRRLRDQIRSTAGYSSDSDVACRIESYCLALLYLLHMGPLVIHDDFIAIDEAQDYSCEEYELIYSICDKKCKMNLFGDLMQNIVPESGIIDWKELKTVFSYKKYTINEDFRNTVQITMYTNGRLGMKLLPIGIIGPEIRLCELNEINEIIDDLGASNSKLRIAIIMKNKAGTYGGASLYTPLEVKGLEFDVVFVIEEGLTDNEKYIAYTRSLNMLYIINPVVEAENNGYPSRDSLGYKTAHHMLDEKHSSLSEIDQDRIKHMLATRFKGGYRISSNRDLERIKKYYIEEYGEKLIIESQELDCYVKSITVLFDDIAYIFSEETIAVVRTYLDEVDSPCIYVNAFYKKYSEKLNVSGIFSGDMLMAFIEKNYMDVYCKRDYVYLRPDISPSDMIRQVFDKRETWSLDELSNQLPYIKKETIRSALNGSDYLRIEAGVYTHMDNLDLPDSEGKKIISFVRDRLQSKDYVIANELDFSGFEALNPHCSFSAIRDAVHNKFLADRYNKSGQVITRNGEKLRVLDIMEQYCREAETVSFEELNLFEATFDPEGRTHSGCLIAAHNVMVRVSADLFVAENKVSFDVKRTDEAIALYCRGDFVPIRNVVDFSLLPDAGYRWNLFLLESYVRKFSCLFKYDVRAVNSSNIGVIVRKSFEYDDYDDILAISLAKSSLSLNDKKGVGDYLFEKGYIGWRNLGKSESKILIKAKKLRKEGSV